MTRRRRRLWRFPDEFRQRAMERVRKGESVAAVAQEMDVHRGVLRKWVEADRRDREARPDRGCTGEDFQRLLRDNQQLKQLLAEKSLEVDFFKGALQKVEARRRRRGAAGETASTPRSGK